MVLSACYVGNHSYGNETLYNYNNATPVYLWYLTTGLPFAHRQLRVDGKEFLQPSQLWHHHRGVAQYRLGQLQWRGDSVEADFPDRLHFPILLHVGQQLRGGRPGLLRRLPDSVRQPVRAGHGSARLVPPPSSLTGKLRAMEQEYDYQRDTSIPKNRYSWNFVQDLPFGKGKHFLGNTNKIVDKFIGGWQISGIGTAYKPYTALPTSTAYFPTGTPVQQYGYQYKIQNCTSGTCYPGYLFYNGYIPANLINTANGYEGIPSGYKPAFQPLVPYGATSAPNMPAGTTLSNYWNSNTVWVPIEDGTVQRTTWSGFTPFWHQYLPTDWQWDQDASLIKNVPFKEHYNFRLECDFFNVFNHPGNPNSFVGATGVLNTQTSGETPRVLQLVGRFSW